MGDNGDSDVPVPDDTVASYAMYGGTVGISYSQIHKKVMVTEKTEKRKRKIPGIMVCSADVKEVRRTTVRGKEYAKRNDSRDYEFL